MSEYRFSITTTPANGEVTLHRGKPFRLPSEWTTDSWNNYWDGDHAVGFYEEYARGRRPLGDSDDSERAMSAYTSAKNHGRDEHEALDTLAVRLTGNEEARFIVVGLDRGADLYVLAWSGDPDNTYRDEIEALNLGDIWRIETEVYDPFTGTWSPDDDVCEEYYGEDQMEKGFHKEFPLTEFPSEMFVTAGD
jgi:hypothetical protein